jgi:hypothetical protein
MTYALDANIIFFSYPLKTVLPGEKQADVFFWFRIMQSAIVRRRTIRQKDSNEIAVVVKWTSRNEVAASRSDKYLSREGIL